MFQGPEEPIVDIGKGIGIEWPAPDTPRIHVYR